MDSTIVPEITFTKNEVSLIEEAVRRAAALRGNSAVDRASIEHAVRAEAARGTRNMFGLVKVGSRAGATTV